MAEQAFPDEYVKRARALVAMRRAEEERLRAELPESKGRDDRLSRILFDMDTKLRKDLAALRKEYGIETA